MPISHYTFNTFDEGQTPDAVGGHYATLGNAVTITTGVDGAINGGGVLEMTSANHTGIPVDGARTNNSFTWTDQARTLTFWWKTKTPAQLTSEGTFVSFGVLGTTGARFDVKERGAGTNHDTLRVEVQGMGENSNPTDFDDGNWHFVAVTVPSAAQFKDIDPGIFGDGPAHLRDLRSSEKVLIDCGWFHGLEGSRSGKCIRVRVASKPEHFQRSWPDL